MTKETYHERRNSNQCTWCGAPLPDDYRFGKCPDCLRKDNIRYEDKKIQLKRDPKYNPVIKERIRTLDDMAKEAHEKHLTYGQLQMQETLKRRK